MLRILLFLAALVGASQPGGQWRPSFELVQPDLFSATGGQANAWADADNDGDLDYFVGFRGRPNRFYRNDNGTFRDVAAQVGLADNQETRAVAWADYDLDGDVDLYIGFADPAVPASRAASTWRLRRWGEVSGASRPSGTRIRLYTDLTVSYHFS